MPRSANKAFFTVSRLNPKFDWRKPWQTGYVGPSAPKKIGTDIPIYPVSYTSLSLYRRRLDREWRVMTCLATPYINREQEAPYIAKHGTIFEEELNKFEIDDHRRMPGKPKNLKDAESRKRVANVGNLLHSDRTVEEQYKDILKLTRFD